MKRLVGLGLCLSLVSWNASVALADSSGCSNRTLKGQFGTVTAGTVTFSDGTRSPVAEVGLFKLDGVKNLSGSDTFSFDGNSFLRTFTGTYAVTAACMATFVLTDENGNVGTTSGVIVDNGNSVLLISTNPGDTISGRATRVSNGPGDGH